MKKIFIVLLIFCGLFILHLKAFAADPVSITPVIDGSIRASGYTAPARIYHTRTNLAIEILANTNLVRPKTSLSMTGMIIDPMTNSLTYRIRFSHPNIALATTIAALNTQAALLDDRSVSTFSADVNPILAAYPMIPAGIKATVSLTAQSSLPGTARLDYALYDETNTTLLAPVGHANIDFTRPSLTLSGATTENYVLGGSSTPNLDVIITEPGIYPDGSPIVIDNSRLTVRVGTGSALALATLYSNLPSMLPGAYTLTYNYIASDPNPISGLYDVDALEIQRTLNILDTTPPIIINPQGNTLIIRRNRDLILTPTCSDITSCTLSFSGSIVDSSTGVIDTSRTGTYIVDIIATDSSGNIAKETVTLTIRSSGGGGSSGTPFISNPVDNCPTGDFSGDVYDGTCQVLAQEENIVENENINIEKEEIYENSSDPIIPEDDIVIQEVVDENKGDDILNEPFLFSGDTSLSEPRIFRKEILGKQVEYTLKNTHNSCFIIDALNNADYQFIPNVFPDTQSSYIPNIVDTFGTLQISHGNTNGLFEPKRAITRAEFTKMVLISHCYSYHEEDTTYPLFSDLTPNTWEAQVVHKAQKLGIIHGYTDNSFRPNSFISKAEATKILMRMSIIQVTQMTPLSYSDIEIDWHQDYIEIGENLGIFLPEQDNYMFGPSNTVTREGMVKMIYDVVDLYR